MKPLHIIIQNAPISNGNLGCVALAYSAIYLIDSIMKSRSQLYTLYVSDSNKNRESSITIMDREIKYEPFYNPVPSSFLSLIYQIVKLKRTTKNLRTLKKAYINFDAGQGDSFSDIYGNKRFEWINKSHRTARLFKIPYVLLPQTIGPFTSEKIRKKATYSLTRAKRVLSRDKTSAQIASDLIDAYKVEDYIDLAFLLPYNNLLFDNTKINVGINVSGLLWNGGYNRANQFGLKSDYKQSIHRLIQRFLEIPEVVIHLIPHVLGLEEDSVENDYSAMWKLKKYYNNNRIILAPAFLNPIDAKSYISGMDFFMGARMHSTIAAFSSGVPVVPMSYSRKFTGLFNCTLDYDAVVDLKTETSNEIEAFIFQKFSQRQQIKEKIAQRLETIVNPKLEYLKSDVEELIFG